MSDAGATDAGAASVVVAILAAGGSRRLGTPKQLVPFRGQPLLRSVAAAACGTTAASRIAVVLGARAPEIARCLVGLKLDVLVNADWKVGMATSVRCAASWATAQKASALLLASGDQPYLDAEHLERLMAAHATAGRAVASVYSSVRGVPAIFPQALFASLLELRGDRGAASLLRGASDVVETPWPEGAFDIDEPNDLVRLAAG